MPVSPTDAKSWELVHSVLDWMGENHCYNYSEAFRQLGVAPASYYRAVKRPFVQNRLLLRFRAQALELPEHWTRNGVHLSPAGHGLLARCWLRTVVQGA
jgi:hypothetical protein